MTPSFWRSFKRIFTKPALVIGWLLAIWVSFHAQTSPTHANGGDTFFDGLAAFDAGDIAETVRIWSALVEKGDVQAHVGMAGLYLSGSGVPQNPEKAVLLYRKAADQGDSNGELNLGRLYHIGLGVEKDDVAAYAWLSLAASQGRRWASDKAKEISSGLSASQRNEAMVLIEQIEARRPD